MHISTISNIRPLGFTWETTNPYLFCVHHHDHYPKGNADLGPDASLEGRNIGMDFEGKDGWRMYHGTTIPGFPEHPHRGFETITIVLEGFVDHSDSLGASGRYGNGDVQWMTAGSGLQHAEMFPLLDEENDNPLELFQLWLNLPKAKKMCRPFYKMLWAEQIPVHTETDANNNKTQVTVIAGDMKDTKALPPAPDSWAADINNEVAIWIIKMDKNAVLKIPPASKEAHRTLFFYRGKEVKINGTNIKQAHAVDLLPDIESSIENDTEEAYLLFLQAKPIDEPVVQHGPFVMNTRSEIQDAFYDFQKTRFGGWPWNRPDVVHGRVGRFAKYDNGTEEKP